MAEQVLVGSRVRSALLCALSLAFVAIGVWLINTHGTSVSGWLGVPLGSVAASAWAVQVARPPRLTLNDVGFEVTGWRGAPAPVAWRDIEPVFIWRMHRTQLVSFKYLEGRRPPGASALARMNQGFGVDGSLPTTLPIEAQALTDLMNNYRQRAFDGHSGRA